MKRKILIRYIILMTILIACAAAAWCQARETGKHHEDAVLACLYKAPSERVLRGKYAGGVLEL